MKNIPSLSMIMGAAALCAWLAVGCSTTRVTQSWRAPDVATAPPPQKTLVLALFPNEASRRTLEDNLSNELRREGVTAVPAHRFFESTRDIDRQDVERVAREQGFDSVVMSRFVGVRYDYGDAWPARYGYAPYFGFHGGWYYAPGYYWPEEEAVVETSLFDANDGGHLLWSGTSETVDPDDSVGEMRAIASKVVQRMEDDALL